MVLRSMALDPHTQRCRPTTLPLNTACLLLLHYDIYSTLHKLLCEISTIVENQQDGQKVRRVKGQTTAVYRRKWQKKTKEGNSVESPTKFSLFISCTRTKQKHLRETFSLQLLIVHTQRIYFLRPSENGTVLSHVLKLKVCKN
jgi:hypothetical protein